MGIRYQVMCLTAVIIPLLGCSSHVHQHAVEIKTEDPVVNEPLAAKAAEEAPITQAENPAQPAVPATKDENPAPPPVPVTNDQNPAPEEIPETKDDIPETSTAAVVNVDPYEKFNRRVFAVNMTLDKYIFKPVAHGYDTITPVPIRKGIGNFFANLDMLNTIPNDLLQGKTAYFTADTWRFILNSTLGIGGLFDVATRFGLPKHHEDFGLTLAYWGGECGLKPQPYLMLPVLGSTTTRDAFGKIPTYATWPFTYIDPQYYNYGAWALSALDKRADLLPADKLVEDSFDPYIFVRSAYLQSRNHQIEKNRHETNFPPYTTETEASPTEDDNTGNEL